MPKQLNLTDLVSIRTLEKIQDNFSTATGIATVIRDTKGNAITKMSNSSEMWKAISKNPNIIKESNELLLTTFEKCFRQGQVQIIKRYLDCHAFVVPIYVEGRIVAFFSGGLTRYGNPKMNQCVEESTKLGVDVDTFLEMYWALPLVNAERLMACANLLKIIASTISTIAKEGTEAKEKFTEATEINQLLEKKIMKNAVELHQSEERYQKLFNTINDGVYMTNEAGILQEINTTGARLLGYERQEILGKNMRTIYVHPQDRDTFLEKLYKEGHIELFHAHVRLKNGSTSHFETNATTIKDINGKIIGVQGIFRDINQRTHSNIRHDTSKITHNNASNYKGTSQKA